MPFSIRTNQTTLRLSTHVANDWWGFYCDYVFLSLTVSHSPKLNWADDIKERMRRMFGAFENDAHFNRQSLSDTRFVMQFSWEIFSSSSSSYHTIIFFGEFIVIWLCISLNDDNIHTDIQTYIQIDASGQKREKNTSKLI